MSNPSPASALLSPIFASAACRGDLLRSRHAAGDARFRGGAGCGRRREAGLIPAEAVGPIEAACKAELYDLAEIGKAAALAGNVAIPLVKALTAKVRESARGYVHWGATSQDVIDTATMLMAREALRRMRGELTGGDGGTGETHRRRTGTR